MNGTTLIEDLAPLYDRPFIGGELGQFGQGQTLTFTMTHHDESTWLAAKTEIIVKQCGSFCNVVFSLVPIYGTPYETGDWGSWPTNICMNITCSNSEEEARRYLVSTWDQGKFVFGEPILLYAMNTGPCINGSDPLAEGTTFNFTITEGQEYALLHDIYSGNEGTSLSGIPQYYGIGSARLKVIGDEPPQPIYVTVEAGINGINSCSGRFEIRPGDLKIIPTKSTVVYGDTLRFDVWKKLPDGSVGSFKPGSYFDFLIIDGNNAGYLYLPDSSQVDDGVWGYLPTAMFAAVEETPQSNSTEVIVQVTAYEPEDPGEPCLDCLPASITPTPPISLTPLADRQTREALRPKTNPVSPQQIKLAELKGSNLHKDGLARLVKKNPDGSYSFGNRNQKVTGAEPKSVDSVQQTTVKNSDGSYSILTSNRTSSKTNSSAVSLQSTESGGPLVGILTIEVVKDSLDHFKVTIVPDTAATEDTVAFTEGAKLVIQAQNKDSINIEYDGNTLLKLSLATNEEYGTFINANGDTLKTTPVQLTDVLYSDAKAGRIKFAAVKKNPDSLVTCKIRVEKQSDPTKYGERDAVVVEQTLKIVMVAPYEVVPRNLRGLRNPPNPTDENKKRFTVQLTRNKVGVANHPFLLTTDYVDGTGGHDHITPRRTENRENYGYFILRRNDTVYDRPYNGQTQSDGREIFDYVSSFFGDSMKIIVKSTNPVKEKYFKDSITIVEKVGGLNNFAMVASDIWGLTGNTGTTSQRECPGTEIHHSSNHYVTANTSRRLQAAIRTFAEWSGSERGGRHYLVLEINDMSLIYGGLFDICSNWLPPHQTHRRGTGVDIDGSAIRFDGQGPVNLHTTLAPDGRTFLDHLTSIMRNIGGTRANETSIHYNF
jgi:hypothetical protein